jgi:hypothetical protein
VTGNRARRLLREDMERRFYRLWQFLGCYLHEDWPEMHGSPQAAVDAAIADYPIEYLQEVRHQLVAVITENEDPAMLRDVLNDGLGVNVWFKQPEEAREFADHVEAKLMASIKAHFKDNPRKG